LVTEVVPRAELWDRAHAIAASIAARPPQPIQGTVRAIWESLDMTRGMALQNGLAYTHIGNQYPREHMERVNKPPEFR
jgi:enoyl-CoA hydratase/carnithine racemase